MSRQRRSQNQQPQHQLIRRKPLQQQKAKREREVQLQQNIPSHHRYITSYKPSHSQECHVAQNIIMCSTFGHLFIKFEQQKGDK